MFTDISHKTYPDQEETVEDLQLNGLKLIQKKSAFRFGMDSVLLAHFASIRPCDLVADLGTGNAILPILLKGRDKGKYYYAVEIQTEAAELAERNAALNHMDGCMQVIHGDVEEIKHIVQPGSLDAVICNPPYWHPEASLESPFQAKATARNQKNDTIDRFFRTSFEILKGRGKMFLIYPAPQMLYIMKKLQNNHLEPKRFRLVYPNANKPANLVLLEAVKDAKPTLHPMAPLIIYREDGNLTNELKSVYHI